MSFASPPSYNSDPRDEIARLEERIEMLVEGIERCRKLALASRLAMIAGLTLMVLMLLGVIAAIDFSLIAAIALLLGGIVVLGSNRSTRMQNEAALAAAEARRHELIGSIDLQTVKPVNHNGSGHWLTS